MNAHEKQQPALSDYLPAYLSDLAERNFSGETIYGRRKEILGFLSFCTERSIVSPVEITVSFMERYAKYETSRISEATGRRLSTVTAIHSLSTIRSFLGYLVRKQAMLFNPALEVELPKMGRRLPRNVLSAIEVERMMLVPDIKDPVGLRNRAILELLYSTGMRRGELARLDLADIDFAGGTVFIRQAKGLTDRIAPAGERALLWVSKYIAEARPGLPGSEKLSALFLSAIHHRGLSAGSVSEIVSDIKTAAGIEKSGAAHMLRHTAATLMLENGADVRYVQQFLGHKELNSTQRYTHVAIRALHDVHAKTHPANFDEPATPEDPEEQEDEVES